MTESEKERIEKQLVELETKAKAAMNARDFNTERQIDGQIVELRKALKKALPRANRKLTEEDWKKIETEGPYTAIGVWGGYWTMKKSDDGPQRYHFTNAWTKSLKDTIESCMKPDSNPYWYHLVYRYEDVRGSPPKPYTMWHEHATIKHFYICGVVDGADGKFFKFPRLIDLYHAKDYALELLRKEGRL
ncbi:MAG: hypothetical protein JRN68_06355 [Nitrososphaerota archaeon]|nr:hypothetical protein [Ferrimicrobium acidiphilum]MDG6934303.1 hypothetical protein [Nitrososphaerota archaeon]